MAKISFKNMDAFGEKLQSLERHFAKDATLEKAVAAGAAVVADEIRANLEALPEEDFRFLSEGATFSGLSASQKEDLAAGFGLTPIERDKNGLIHTKAGFDGYGSFPTKQYPQGVPNALLARAVESGSSVRQKRPFVRPAVTATRTEAINKMADVIDEESQKIMNGGK